MDGLPDVKWKLAWGGGMRMATSLLPGTLAAGALLDVCFFFHFLPGYSWPLTRPGRNISCQNAPPAVCSRKFSPHPGGYRPPVRLHALVVAPRAVKAEARGPEGPAASSKHQSVSGPRASRLFHTLMSMTIPINKSAAASRWKRHLRRARGRTRGRGGVVAGSCRRNLSSSGFSMASRFGLAGCPVPRPLGSAVALPRSP